MPSISNPKIIEIHTFLPLSEEDTIKTVFKAAKDHPDAYGCRINGTFYQVPGRVV
jgi:hypothetical protein